MKVTQRFWKLDAKQLRAMLAPKRLIAMLILPAVVLTQMPPAVWAQESMPAHQAPAGKASKAVMAKPDHVKTGPHKLQPVKHELTFSSDPSDLEIETARVFQEPLIPMSGKALPGENKALAGAILSFKKKDKLDDHSDFTAFFASFPESRWRSSIELNLGNLDLKSGYFSRAFADFRSAFESAKNEKGDAQQAIASAALAEIAMLNGRLGRMDDLKQALAQAGKRKLTGSTEQLIECAKACIYHMKAQPEKSFRCGPYAVASLLSAKNKAETADPILRNSESTKQGTNLLQVKQLADQVGLKLQMAKRPAGAPIMVPSVVHWKLDHFGAIVQKQADGNYLVEDPTFGSTDRSISVSEQALDAESDGYFLVPAGKLPQGWRAVADSEGKLVWGKGNVGGVDGGSYTPPECVSTDCCQGMPRAALHLLQNTLNLKDVPLSYVPPIGPSISNTINFNHLQANQPITFTFSNLGQNWAYNWVAYLTVDPGTGNATVRLPNGGVEVFVKSGGVYKNDIVSQALLVDMGSGVYQRRLKDGSVQVFSQADSASPPRIFMTQVLDPQGNTVLLQYDANFRLTSITDAISQVTTVSYVSNTVGNSGFYKISQITDPFGRSCSFSYDSTNTLLLSMTDVIGITTSFTYDSSSSFITSMTTPYGTTSFNRYVISTLLGPITGLKFTLPDGSHAVAENWYYIDSYFWDRHACELYPNDPGNSNHSHSVHTNWYVLNDLVRAVPNLIQKPLEAAVTYFYQGGTQGGPGSVLPIGLPAQVSKTIGNNIITVTVGGTKTTGDVMTIQVNDQNLLFGSESVHYTVLAGDNLASIASGLAAAVNADTNISHAGIQATAFGAVITLTSTSNRTGLGVEYVTQYTPTTSGGATETLTVASAANQLFNYTIGGTATVGDVVTLSSFWYGGVPYTVQAGDTLASIATGLAAAINSAPNWHTTGGITAVSSGPDVTGVSHGQHPVLDLGYTTSSGATETVALNYTMDSSQQNYGYEYNTFGNVTRMADPAGRTLSYTYAANNIDLLQITETQGTDNVIIGQWTYDSHHRPLTYIDGSNQQTSYSYNSAEQLLTITDANSKVTTLTYTSGYLTKIDGPLAGSNDATTFSYDGYGRLAQTTDSEGYTLAYGYDAANRPTQTTYPDGTTEQTVYDRLDAVLMKDRIARWTENAFDSLRQLTFEIDPLGRKTQYQWCTCGSLAKLTDPAGQVTTWNHDLEGRPVSKTYADGSQVKYAYDPAIGWLSSKTDALNQVTNYLYLPDNTPFQVIYSNAVNPTSTVSYKFDPNFKRLSSIENGWGMLSYSYNPYGNNLMLGGSPTTGDIINVLFVNSSLTGGKRNVQYTVQSSDTSLSTLAASIKTAINSDAVLLAASITATSSGNYILIHSPSSIGQVALSFAANSLVTETLGGTITAGNTLSITAHDPALPSGQKTVTYTTSALDTLNLAATGLAALINADTNYQTAGITATSGITTPVVSITSHSVNATTYTHSTSSGATETIAQAGAPSETATNFGSGRLVNVHNNVMSNSDITYLYDSLGRTINRSINASSNSTSWGYDAMSRITSEVNPLGTFSYAYVDDVSGSSKGTLRLASIAYPNSQTTNFDWYDNAGDQRLKTITNLDPSSNVLSKFNYGYDAAGEITQWLQQQNGSSLNYSLGYDAAGQLTSAQAGAGNIAPPHAKEYLYAYDSASNRTGVQTTSVDTARIGGSKTTGDVVTISVKDAALSGGSEAVNYTVASSDTLAKIALGLATAINTDANLQGIGVSAIADGTNKFINIKSASGNPTTYSGSTSGGATETIAFGIFKNGVENAVIGGTKTTSDSVSIKVIDPALAGGSKTISYTVLAGDNLNSIAAGVKTAINADAGLSTLGVTATAASNVVSISSTSTNLTTYSSSTSSGATETVSLALNSNAPEVVSISGSKTTADVLTLTFIDAGLSGGSHGVSYTVLSGDSLSSIATAIASAINSDASLSAIGVSASASGKLVTIQSNSPNLTAYRQSTSSGATELIGLTQPLYGFQTAVIGGSKTTGNVLTLSVYDQALSGGKEVVSYTVLSGDTLTSIASAIASAINADANLSAIGVTATSNSTVVYIESLSPNVTTYAQSVSSGATETIGLAPSANVQQAAFNNVNELVSLAQGGASRFQATTNKAVKSASVAGQTVAITSAPANTTSFAPSVAGVPTETMTLSGNTDQNGAATLAFGGTPTAGDTVSLTVNSAKLNGVPLTISYVVKPSDSISSIASTFGNPGLFSNTAFTQTIGLQYSLSGSTLTIFPNSFYYGPGDSVTFSTAVTGVPTESVAVVGSNGNATATVSGSVTAGDVLSIDVQNASLPGGHKKISYTAASGNTTTSEATGLKNAINADTDLAAINMTATSSSAVVTIATASTTYTSSTSGGATETITLGSNTLGNSSAVIGGSKTTGDTLTITAHNAQLPSGSKAVTYTVGSGDDLVKIAAGVASAMNADTDLQALGVSASNSNAAALAFSRQFIGNGNIPSGQSIAQVSAVDGGSNTATNSYAQQGTSGSSTSLSFDANGNMVGDGTNSYSYDAENRLISIVYPESGNHSDFTYDGLGRNVKILEYVSSSLSSTTQFVWCGNDRCEARDGLGTVIAQYSAYGETISGTTYFWTRDHLGSVRELIDTTGTVKDQRTYDPFGRTAQLQGTIPADFQFGNYYMHARSGLNFTRTRAYSCAMGRFLGRDPIGEAGGVNPFAYVSNSPSNRMDPLGLDGCSCSSGGGNGGGGNGGTTLFGQVTEMANPFGPMNTQGVLETRSWYFGGAMQHTGAVPGAVQYVPSEGGANIPYGSQPGGSQAGQFRIVPLPCYQPTVLSPELANPQFNPAFGSPVQGPNSDFGLPGPVIEPPGTGTPTPAPTTPVPVQPGAPQSGTPQPGGPGGVY